MTLEPLIDLDVGQSTVTCPDVCVAVSVAGELKPAMFTTSFPELHCGITGLLTLIVHALGVGAGVGVAVGVGLGVETGVGVGVADGLGDADGVGEGDDTTVPLCAASN